jgi:hypothetical protein
MNIKRIALFALATITVAASLTGCSFSNNDSYDEQYQTIEEETYGPPTIYVNPDTGYITRYIDYKGDTVFDEGYSKTDIDTMPPSTYMPEASVDLSTTIEIEGKNYPIAQSVSWEFTGLEETLIPFYNERIAQGPSTDPSVPSSPGFMGISLQDSVNSYIKSGINSALKNGALPAAKSELTGKSVITINQQIAQAFAAGKPAWEVFDATYGNADGSEYHYIFTCATHEVRTSSTEMVSVIETMFAGSNARFNGNMGITQVIAESAQPCDVASDNPEVYDESNNPPMMPPNP